MIALQDFTLRIKDRVFMNHIRYSFPEHGAVCIYGPSGCGKTTFIRAVVGQFTDYEGKLWLKDRNSIFYAAAEHSLFLNNTVEDNLRFISADSAKLQYYKKRYRLNSIWNVCLKHCSLGEKQRVLLCMAFLSEKKLILLDETISNLDSKVLSLIKEDISSLKNQVLWIIVSHHVDSIREICDIVIPFQDFPSNEPIIYPQEEVKRVNCYNKIHIKTKESLWKTICFMLINAVFLVSLMIFIRLGSTSKEQAEKTIIRLDTTSVCVSEIEADYYRDSYFYGIVNTFEINCLIMDYFYPNCKKTDVEDNSVFLPIGLFNAYKDKETYSFLGHDLKIQGFYDNRRFDYNSLDTGDFLKLTYGIIINEATYYRTIFETFGIYLADKRIVLKKAEQDLQKDECLLFYDSISTLDFMISDKSYTLTSVGEFTKQGIDYDTLFFNIAFISEELFEELCKEYQSITVPINYNKHGYAITTAENYDFIYEELSRGNEYIYFNNKDIFYRAENSYASFKVMFISLAVISGCLSICLYCYLYRYLWVNNKEELLVMKNYFIRDDKRRLFRFTRIDLKMGIILILSGILFLCLYSQIKYAWVILL